MKRCCYGAASAPIVFLVLLLCLVSSGSAQSSNGVLREVYQNIGGSTIPDLANAAIFPNSPTLETIQTLFEAPNEFDENYGQRMRALLLPPVTGNYTFWVASDDQGVLYLSTDATPATKVQIATVNAWTSSREWTKEANQQSATNIFLTAGQRYYIEALQKEGGGGDNLAVRWRLPNGTIEEPIPNNRLLVFGLGPPVIAQQPASLSVVESSNATFTVLLQRMIGATFQWHRNGVALSGATNNVLAFGPVSLADSNTTYFCGVTNSLGGTNSTVASLAVVPDTTRPTLGTVGNLGEPQVLFVVFSEPVEAATATNAANYTLSGGVAVTRAVFGPDNRTIILSTTPMALNTTYTLTVNNVRDRAATPNAILANSQRTFSTATSPIDIGFQSLVREPLGPTTRRHGVVISEVMYHPTNRVDGKNLEFIEIYNSQPWPEELGGWRISSAIDFNFPSNVVLNARSFLVVAANPTDFRSVYSFTNVLGPFVGTNNLPNSSGTLRLRNNRDAIVFEMSYSDESPFPVGADGPGHSLVLARPSYGERDPRAWALSDATGGSPGAADIISGNIYRTVVINEFLASSALPSVDYIELYNYGNTAVNLAGCILTDHPETNKFVIATTNVPSTFIGPRSFLVLTETQLGFALSSDGEAIFFKHPSARRVLDSVRYGAQERGVPTGRSPDGAATFSRLLAPTPGTNNALIKTSPVVINEIMYDPASDNSDDEYLELFNRGTNTVNMGGWRVRDGVSFNIPGGTMLAPGGFLVIARDAVRLRAIYPGLTTVNCLGNYSGSLANSGERIELNMPEAVVSTNAQGQSVTNTLYITVSDVAYGTGGRWGQWSHGGGSSLELTDARADTRLAPNWADSEESAKSPWVLVEASGVMDNGWADATQLHVTLLGAGEALIDNIEVIPQGSTNVIGNGTFENGAAGWVFQGNHNATSWEPGEGFSSQRSLRLRATGRGDSGSNRVRTQLPFTLSPGTTVTLRARVRWLKGNPNVLLRLRGNWSEATAYTLGATNLGTPGATNSRALPNSGPAMTDVRHDPPLPAANQPVLVVVKISDPDGVALLTLNYRIDPATNYIALAMTNNGAGLFSAVLPAQTAGATASFFIRAVDGFGTPATTTFPDDAPARECVVRWGDTSVIGTLGTYRFWLNQRTADKWSAEERMSNKAKDITFIYGNTRVVYNAGGWYHGSPYHSPGYNSPTGVSCDYDLGFPRDDLFLGETDINLFRPGNGGGDSTAQTEIQGYWFGQQFGIPFLYHRPVFVFVNGQQRDYLFHDAQQPNGDFVDQWFPNDPDGDLHKIQLGFEFGDQAYGASEPGYAVVGADLNRYTTTGGVKKAARYRATWPRRSSSAQEISDYTNIYTLVETALTNAPINSDAYTLALTNAVDVEEWFKVHVTQHLYNNPDSFSYGGGQNAYAYKPEKDTWKLLLWDVDFAFGGDPNDANLLGIGGAEHGPRNDHAPFRRIYWQALIEAANGMMTSARSDSILDARYNGMISAGATSVGSPANIKAFIATRRTLILNTIAANQAPFAITSNGGVDFSTNRNLITLTGTAPLNVRTLLINGLPYPVSWTTVSNWVIRIPLVSGMNSLQITGLDPRGAAVAGVSGLIRVNFTGANELAQDRIAINEIMYNPVLPDASYVEIFNSSVSNAFDLSNWRINGIDFNFPFGYVIEPGAYAVVVQDKFAFAAAYGVNIPLAGEFSGNLDYGGETLTLIKPGANPALDTTVDRVSYDDDLPWPPAADGTGPSLQLMDPAQDNNRSANWAAVGGALTNAPELLVSITNLYRFNTNDDLTAVNWTAPGYNDTGWQQGLSLLYNETAGLPAPKNTLLGLGRLTYYFRTRFNFSGVAGGVSLKLQTVLDDGAVFYLNGQEIHRLRMPAGAVGYSTLANAGVGDAVFEGPFILPGSALLNGENVLAVEAHQSTAGSSDIVLGLTLETTYDSLTRYTPGALNSTRATLPAFPLVWLNEVLPTNFFLGTNGISDRFGDRDPWVELYNGGTNALSLAGFYLANNYTNLGQWAFPSNAAIAPKQFLLVWLDGEPGESATNELHASFRAAPESGSVVLSRGVNLASVIDHLNYAVTVPGRSYGSFPDGEVGGRRDFPVVTPGATNNPTIPPIDVRINEWMADNTATLADPADGDFEDWIELFNPGTNRVFLTGYFMSDTLTNTTQWAFPSGTHIPPRGYLLVWADGETGQNSPSQMDVHASFSLAKGGEAIGLFAPDGTLIDGITFGAQISNVSQGRFPDGAGAIYFMSNSTPRSANYVFSSNTPPLLDFISNKPIGEGNFLSFTATATDTNLPAQLLTWSFASAVPPGVSLNPTNGLFTWRPTEEQGPGTHGFTIVVTDNGVPPLSAQRSFFVSVLEVNNAPVLAPINSRTINEGALLTVTNYASDPDPDPTVLAFTLDPGAPAGMEINYISGLLTWQTGEADGPGTYTVTVRVTDNGAPPLSDTKTFTVFVNEVNVPPSLGFPQAWTVFANTPVQFTAVATDPDQPAQMMTFALDTGALLGATLDAATGQFSWTPTALNQGSNHFILRVTDSWSPPGTATRNLTVTVLPPLQANISRNGSVVDISFPTISGRTYRVEYKASLTDSSWTPLGSDVVASASSQIRQDNVGPDTQRFYRVVQRD